MPRLNARTIAVGAVLLGLTGSALSGQEVALTVIADNQTVIPDGGTDLFSVFGAVAISGSNVLFYGENGLVPKRGIYALVGGQLRVIADNNTLIPDGGGDLFSSFGTPPSGRLAISGGNVAFYGEAGLVDKRGVYGLLGGQLRVIADNSTLIPDGGADLFGTFGAVAVSGGNVAFYGENGLIPKFGVYALIGGELRVVADNHTLIPDGGTDTFANFSAVAISGENVVFYGENGFVDKRGYYAMIDGKLQVLVDSETIPRYGVKPTVAVSGGKVVFYGEDGFGAVYGLRAGDLRVIADHTTMIPDGDGDLFDGFGVVSISGRSVVFYGENRIAPKRGMYGLMGGRLRVIADNHTLIPDGGTDMFNGFGNIKEETRAAISDRMIVFYGENGLVPKRGVYGATPLPTTRP